MEAKARAVRYPAGRKGMGGSAHHRDPNCQCNTCRARLREKKADLVAARVGGGSLASQDEVINADNPLVTIAQKPSVKASVAKWVEMRLDNPRITKEEAAKKLGLSTYSLGRYISNAVKEGWLKFDDPMSRIEHEIVPKTLDNISQFLTDKNERVTIETAKGVLWPAYKESIGIHEGQTTVLALKIEAVEPGQAKMITGEIVGTPKRILEAELS